MNKQEIVDNAAVRPLARVVARELSQEEVAMVAGGCQTGGNTLDCTTGGQGGVTDRDHLK